MITGKCGHEIKNLTSNLEELAHMFECRECTDAFLNRRAGNSKKREYKNNTKCLDCGAELDRTSVGSTMKYCETCRSRRFGESSAKAAATKKLKRLLEAAA